MRKSNKLQPGYPKRMRIKTGYIEAGRTGTALAEAKVGQLWTMIVFDDEEDPDCYKSVALEEIPG